MNVAAVRKLAHGSVRERLRAAALSAADGQRMNVRCDECGWYMRNVLVGDGKRAFEAHLSGARHTKRNHKRGPQAKTRDRHEGRSWAK